MKTYFLSIAVCIAFNVTFAQSEEDQIKSTLQTYIKGTSHNQPEVIKEAFYKEANLFLSHKEKELWIVPIAEYASWFEKKEKGKFNGRIGNVLSIDQENDIAIAKVEILSEGKETRYIDLFLLKRIKGKWQIISKAATRTK